MDISHGDDRMNTTPNLRFDARSLATALLILLLAPACSGGGDTDKDSQTSTGAVQIEVRSLEGQPLGDADVTVRDQTSTTTEEGRTRVDGLSAGSAVVRAEADGFAPATSHVEITAGTTTRTAVELSKEGTVASISVGEGGEVTHEGTTVSVPADAVVDSEGNSVSGDIELSVTSSNFDETGGSALPGPTDRVRNSNGSPPRMIAAVAGADISLRKNGERLQIREGSSIQVAYTLPDRATSTYSPGDTIDAYWYDDTAGEWVREGSGEVQATEDGGLKWVAEVPHLTYWGACRNVDKYNCIQAKVVDARGQPVPGAEVAAIGARNGARAEARTGSGGLACAQFSKGTEVRLVVYPPQQYDVFRAERTYQGSGNSGACFDDPDSCVGETIEIEGRPGQPDAGMIDSGGPSPDGGSSTSEILDLSVGEEHTCAVKQSGEIYCIGRNKYGQLGNGSAGGQTSTAVQVQGISSAVQVAAGANHTCAVLQDGTARCWGLNRDGQLGNGSTADDPVTSPVQVQGLSSVTDISAGGNTCVVLQSGETRCWGQAGLEEQLGPDQDDSATPVDVPTLPKASRVSVGQNHACAVLQTGEIHCWGSNEFGQLGSGEERQRGQPSSTSKVKGISSAVAVSASKLYTCARVEDGKLRCWGMKGPWLGDGSSTGETDDFETAVAVTGISSATFIGTGANHHACAALQDGTARCWGGNSSGELGDGSTDLRSEPVQVSNLSSVQQIDGGISHTCATVQSGPVYCWGSNNFGQLGLDESQTESTTPVEVPFGP